jgi:hypothetical protein
MSSPTYRSYYYIIVIIIIIIIIIIIVNFCKEPIRNNLLITNLEIKKFQAY